jgi:hypothetical protein
MKNINLILDDQEILLLRMQARLMPILLPEMDEMTSSFCDKVLSATVDCPDDARREIGKAQRAFRAVKQTQQYAEFMRAYSVVMGLVQEEMDKDWLRGINVGKL